MDLSYLSSVDWFPLWNSLRFAAIFGVLIFFLGILCAYYMTKLPRLIKGALDVLLTLPLVLSQRYAPIFC